MSNNDDASRGPVSTLPGNTIKISGSRHCDCHPWRLAEYRVQGETDSFGCEYTYSCQMCHDLEKTFNTPETSLLLSLASVLDNFIDLKSGVVGDHAEYEELYLDSVRNFFYNEHVGDAVAKSTDRHVYSLTLAEMVKFFPEVQDLPLVILQPLNEEEAKKLFSNLLDQAFAIPAKDPYSAAAAIETKFKNFVEAGIAYAEAHKDEDADRTSLATETCEWCGDAVEEVFPYRDPDEGFSGPVYYPCLGCLRKRRAQDIEAYTMEYDEDELQEMIDSAEEEAVDTVDMFTKPFRETPEGAIEFFIPEQSVREALDTFLIHGDVLSTLFDHPAIGELIVHNDRLIEDGKSTTYMFTAKLREPSEPNVVTVNRKGFFGTNTIDDVVMALCAQFSTLFDSHYDYKYTVRENTTELTMLVTVTNGE